jgi:hypothetical protein
MLIYLVFLGFIVLLAGLYIYRERRDGALLAGLLNRMDELQADNRLLMEALSRKEGGPVIFRPRESIPSKGWFDGKPSIKPEEKI